MASVEELTENDRVDGWSEQDYDSAEDDFLHSDGSVDGSDDGGVFNSDDENDEYVEDTALFTGQSHVPPLPPAVEHPTFKHESLEQDSIRLLKIMPGRSYDDLRFRLYHFALDTNPKYVAISYRWGTLQTQAAISIKSDKLNISLNAYWALFYQRQIHQKLFVWIDSICIDQQNVAERNHQVALMTRIYSQASNVYIWLGLPTLELETAIVALEKFEAASRSVAKEPVSTTETARAVQPLFELDYWRRVWIFQEILLATNLSLMVGTRLLPWDRAATAISQLEESMHDLDSVRYVKKLISQRSKGYGGHIYRLEVFLREYRFAECSDVRDKIYGLLEIWNKQALVRFEADYSKSIVDLLLTAYAYIVDYDQLPVTRGLSCCKTLLDILGFNGPSKVVVRCLSAMIEASKPWMNQGRPEYLFTMDNGNPLRVPCAQIYGASSFIVKVRSKPIREDTPEEFKQWVAGVFSYRLRTTTGNFEQRFRQVQALDDQMSDEHSTWHQLRSWRARMSEADVALPARRAYIDSYGTIGVADSPCVEGDFCYRVTGETSLIFTGFHFKDQLHRLVGRARYCWSVFDSRYDHMLEKWLFKLPGKSNEVGFEELREYFSKHRDDALLLDPPTAFYFSEELAEPDYSLR